MLKQTGSTRGSVSTAKPLGEELAKVSLDVASRENATYADLRLVHSRNELVTMVNDNPSSEESDSLGVGIRVLYGGTGWGFASTDETDTYSVKQATMKAVSLAKSATKVGSKVSFAKEPVHIETWESPRAKDPFTVSLEEKNELLRESTSRMKEKDVVARRGQLVFANVEKYFASSEGSRISQRMTYSGAYFIVAGKGPTGMQRRSFQQYMAKGYELIDEMKLLDEAADLTKDVVALGSAGKCPEGQSDIILSGDQMGLQVHESCGHPIELDRVLGYEANFAGRSFLTPDKLGKLQYGSEHVNIVMDSTLEHGQGLGTFGFDDEGVAAQRRHAVKDGKFVGYLMSRETAAKVGEARSNGCMRAEGYKLPIIRMTNVSLEPGDWKYDELIEDTKDGILMVTNYGWSIDQKRYNFQFNCEKGYKIRNGSLEEMVRGPGYSGITPEFWNKCDAVCDKDSWVLWGTPNCGKGQPGQTMGTGHGASPTRFRNVKVFGAS